MGKLVDGNWLEGSIISSDRSGAFDRKPRTFRNVISPDHNIYTPDSGRYHLYVSYACPWAHRVLIYRELKNLQAHISVSVVHPDMLTNGWGFAKSVDNKVAGTAYKGATYKGATYKGTTYKGTTQDHLFDSTYLYQVYQKAQADISTSVTVPILWDKKTNTIVNNESSEIIRMLNVAFNELTKNSKDYYPKAYQHEIDLWNDELYETVNNGVYRCGFATSQVAYDNAVQALFKTLDKLDAHLEGKQFLVGEQLSEADIRLITTLVRFDLIYYVHFKCSLKRIADYPNLSRYTKQLYQLDAVRNTTNFEHIKRHYYFSHETINPHRIVPLLPTLEDEI